MKRIIAVLIAAVLLASCLAFSVSAAGGGVLKAGRVSAKAGDEITIPVTYEGNPGVCIIRVTLAYDTRAVEYVDITKSASDYFNYTVTDKTEGSIIVLMDSPQIANVTEDIELFSVKFKVKNDAKAGRALFPVYCEKGMATAFKKVDGKYTTESIAPSTSTGSVTILCDEHTFDLQMTDGSVQCSDCGAIKDSGGSVSVDLEAGLPEVDVSADSSSQPPVSGEQGTDSTDESVTDGEKDDDGGLKLGHFIPIAAAVLIAVAVCLACIVVKEKKSRDTKE